MNEIVHHIEKKLKKLSPETGAMRMEIEANLLMDYLEMLKKDEVYSKVANKAFVQLSYTINKEVNEVRKAHTAYTLGKSGIRKAEVGRKIETAIAKVREDLFPVIDL